MSEVQRYYVGKYGLVEGESLGRLSVVLGADFDRVTAERDALQQRLTAADERNDNRDSEIFAQVQSALHRSFSLGQIYWQQADSDSTCQQNKSDQTMEVQEQHILNVLKSLGAALKPAEGLDRRDMSAKVRLMKRDGGGDAARLALRPENQRITPARFKCLACGEYHEGSGNMPCPSMSPYSRIEQ